MKMLMLMIVVLLVGCSDARIATSNLTKAADNFEIDRRIVFYNGITGGYALSIEGRCSIFPTPTQLDVVCKIGPTEFKRHSLGISDNLSWFMEQVNPKSIDVYHYRVIFKPSAIVPDIEFK
jgi:hypothetical protein